MIVGSFVSWFLRQHTRYCGYHVLRPALALFTVALPLANPTPRPLVPLDRNIGAFRSMSGTMINRT